LARSTAPVERARRAPAQEARHRRRGPHHPARERGSAAARRRYESNQLLPVQRPGRRDRAGDQRALRRLDGDLGHGRGGHSGPDRDEEDRRARARAPQDAAGRLHELDRAGRAHDEPRRLGRKGRGGRHPGHAGSDLSALPALQHGREPRGFRAAGGLRLPPRARDRAGEQPLHGRDLRRREPHSRVHGARNGGNERDRGRLRRRVRRSRGRHRRWAGELAPRLATARVRSSTRGELGAVVNHVREYTEREMAGLSVPVGGCGAVFADRVGAIVDGQVSSLLVSFLVVMVLNGIGFRSVGAGVWSMIPLALAVPALFGLMGTFGIELNVVTAMLSSIMIGVGVDYTVHFLWRYRDERREGYGADEAAYRALTTVGRGIVFNALSVIFGFAVLGLSNFTPVRFFGFLVVVSIAACMFAAVQLMPALVAWADPR